MNLAIEYLSRSGQLRSSFKFPFSLFVFSEDGEDRRVITVCESFNKNKLSVKHWLLSLCNIDETVPLVNNYEINTEDLFTSQHTVLQKYNLHPYCEQTYKSGGKQNNDEPMASYDEQTYFYCFDHFMNTKAHYNRRLLWLWWSFKNAYKFVEYEINIGISKLSVAKFLENKHPKLLKKWELWCKYMLDMPNEPGTVAGELLFQKEYKIQKKAKKKYVDWMSYDMTVPIFF
jgi:hypothetical protein